MKIDENLLLDKLCQSVRRYMELTIKEYGSYMKPEQLESLNNLKKSDDIVRFNDDKTVTFFCKDGYIKIPRYAVGFLKKLKWVPDLELIRNTSVIKKVRY